MCGKSFEGSWKKLNNYLEIMYHRYNRPKTVAVSPRAAGIHVQSSIARRPKRGSHFSYHEPRPPSITGWGDASGSRTSSISRPVTDSSSTISQGIYINYELDRQTYCPVVPRVTQQPHYVNFQEYIAYQLYR